MYRALGRAWPSSPNCRCRPQRCSRALVGAYADSVPGANAPTQARPPPPATRLDAAVRPWSTGSRQSYALTVAVRPAELDLPGTRGSRSRRSCGSSRSCSNARAAARGPSACSQSANRRRIYRNTERVKGIEPSLSAWENQLDHPLWSGWAGKVAVTCGYVAASFGFVRPETGRRDAVPQQDPQQGLPGAAPFGAA
jgi:hypothetical protein